MPAPRQHLVDDAYADALQLPYAALLIRDATLSSRRPPALELCAGVEQPYQTAPVQALGYGKYGECGVRWGVS